MSHRRIEKVSVTPAEYAQTLLYLDGKPFSLDSVPFMIPIINCGSELGMMMTGRQVGKSTTLSAKILSRLTAFAYHNALYVAPRLDQVAEFSKAKLGAMITTSPYIRSIFMNASVIQQARSKSFLNGSAIVLRSCYLNPDAIRGITANDIYIDEIQDIIVENIPVIVECSSRKAIRHIFYCGTPKTFDNTIQKNWDKSSQHFWAIKCPHCNKWNVELGMANIGKEWLCCAKCGGRIDARTGEYVAKHPDREFTGFHVSQLMIAGAPNTGVPWKRVLEKLNDPLYGLAKFYNECLGYSYDVGQKLLTETDLGACCIAEMQNLTIDRKAEWGMSRVFAGVDWGVLGGNTHTVLTIGGIDCDGVLRVMYAKKYPVDQDPVAQVEEICDTIARAGCCLVAADRGNGHVANAFLRKKLTYARICEIEYKSKVTEGMRYSDKSKTWITDRTRAIAGIVIDIKQQKIQFPIYKVMSPFFEDLLTLSCAYNDNLRAYQILREGETPDDFAHALAYLRLAAKMIGPAPTKKIHQLEEFYPGVGEIITDKHANLLMNFQ